jgi:hypothetical protein
LCVVRREGKVGQVLKSILWGAKEVFDVRQLTHGLVSILVVMKN